jgi:hypothetical protein
MGDVTSDQSALIQEWGLTSQRDQTQRAPHSSLDPLEVK